MHLLLAQMQTYTKCTDIKQWRHQSIGSLCPWLRGRQRKRCLKREELSEAGEKQRVFVSLTLLRFIFCGDIFCRSSGTTPGKFKMATKGRRRLRYLIITPVKSLPFAYANAHKHKHIHFWQVLFDPSGFSISAFPPRGLTNGRSSWQSVTDQVWWAPWCSALAH